MSSILIPPLEPDEVKNEEGPFCQSKASIGFFIVFAVF